MPITRRDYFKPIQLGGCVLWLDGADSSTITGTSPVTQWRDKSVNGYLFTGTGAIISNSGLYFNGSSYLVNGLLTAIPAPYTVFAVGSSTSQPNTFQRMISGGVKIGGDGPYDAILAVGTSNTTPFVWFGYSSGWLANPYLTGAAYSGTNLFMTSGTVSSGTSPTLFGYGNGNQLSSNVGAAFQATSLTGLNIGGGYSSTTNGLQPWYGNINEIIIVSNVLTPQRQQIEAYLAQKWSLTGSLPAGHPGLTSVLYRPVTNTLTKSVYYTQFSPKSIPGASLWLDGADPFGTGVVPANGATVSTWTDKSGSGYNATGGVSPTYNTSQRAIVFNGSSWLSTSYPSVPANETAFIVYQTTSSALANNCFMIGPTNIGGRLILSVNENDGFGLSFKIGSYGVANGSRLTMAQNQIYLGTTTVASTTSFVYLNGTQGPSSTLTYSGTGTTQIGTAVSGSAIYIGFIYEIVIFNRLLSNPERQTVESYLAQKWGLTAALPASHINNTFPAGSPVALQTYISRIKTNIGYIQFPPGTPSINAPTNTGNLTTLTMTWTAPAVTGTAGTVSGYIVYIAASGTQVATQTLGNVLTTTFSPMTTNLNYSYSVAATGPGGTGVASSSSLTTVYYATPGAPTVNTPTNTTDTLNMSWNAPAGTVTSYTVYVLAGGSPAATLTPGLVTSTTYSPMTQSVAYSFNVTATNVTVTSGFSLTSATVTYLGPPATPTSLSIDQIGLTFANFTASTVTNATSYTVQVYSVSSRTNTGGTAVSGASATSSTTSISIPFDLSIQSRFPAGFYYATVTATSSGGTSSAFTSPQIVTMIGFSGSSYSAGVNQSWTSPFSGSVRICLCGGGGGGTNSGSGGSGGLVVATYTIASGTVYTIAIGAGAVGGNSLLLPPYTQLLAGAWGGIGGAGSGGAGLSPGGGMSQFQNPGPTAYIMAGGGGGGGNSSSICFYGNGGNGGDGGGTSGSAGGVGMNYATAYTNGGGGGTASAGGAGGTTVAGSGVTGGAGAVGSGTNGGVGGAGGAGTISRGSGGGGGYRAGGGGGGLNANGPTGGGGGGSSFTSGVTLVASVVGGAFTGLPDVRFASAGFNGSCAIIW
jgi:hypothetical protein